MSEDKRAELDRIHSVTGRIRDLAVPERGSVVIRIEPDSAATGAAEAPVVVCELPAYAPRENFRGVLATLQPGMRVEIGGYTLPDDPKGKAHIRPITFIDLYPASKSASTRRTMR